MGAKRARQPEVTPTAQESGSLARSSRPIKRVRHDSSLPEMPASDSASRLSINRLKKRIRDTTRVLNHSDKLPAGVRIEKERALAGYQHDLAQVASKKERQQMIKKYHMVRFFGQYACGIICSVMSLTLTLELPERQRATRILKRLKKNLSSTTVGTREYENLQSDIHNAEVDLNYAMYHPLDEKYQSLYPPEQRHTNKEEVEFDQKKPREERASRPTLWNKVEQCMVEGTLMALRDGKLGRAPDVPASKAVPKSGNPDTAIVKGALRKEKGKSKTEILPKDEDDESDGGFFEK